MHQNTTTALRFYHYNKDEMIVQGNTTLAACQNFDRETHVNWLSVRGLQDKELIQRIGEEYHIHPLIVEDILHTKQRPKVESYGNMLFITLRLYYIINEQIKSQQISFVLQNNVLISFREHDTGIFQLIKDRIEAGQNQIRRKGEDYLLYSLLDAIVDNYFVVLDSLSERIQALEDDITLHPQKSQLLKLQKLKRTMITMRKHVWPVRELFNNLERNEIDFFEQENKPYLRDLNDHIFRVIDTIETYRDILTSLMDLYHSMLSNRMNEVMKTLTVLSSIFIPLTFIVGVYGMNFDNMPELHSQNGYFILWGIMGALTLGLIIYFKKQKWF